RWLALLAGGVTVGARGARTGRGSLVPMTGAVLGTGRNIVVRGIVPLPVTVTTGLWVDAMGRIGAGRGRRLVDRRLGSHARRLRFRCRLRLARPRRRRLGWRLARARRPRLGWRLARGFRKRVCLLLLWSCR